MFRRWPEITISEAGFCGKFLCLSLLCGDTYLLNWSLNYESFQWYFGNQVIEQPVNKSQLLSLKVNFLSAKKWGHVGWTNDGSSQSSTSEFTLVIFLLSLVKLSIIHILDKHNFYLTHLSSLQGEATEIMKREINCWLSSGFVKGGRDQFSISCRIIQKAGSGAITNIFILIILLTGPVFNVSYSPQSGFQG